MATNVEDVTDAAARPIPASIPMPDHWVRQQLWWQIYSRLARPTLDWLALVGASWAMFLGDWLNHAQGDSTRIIVLGFAGGLFGVRTFEKVKGVA